MKKTIFMIGALIAACAAAALSTYGALQAHASGAPSPTVGATYPASQTASARAGAHSAVSPGVQELARNEGLDLSSLKQVATVRGQRPAIVFAASKGTSTCAYLTGGTEASAAACSSATALSHPGLRSLTAAPTCGAWPPGQSMVCRLNWADRRSRAPSPTGSSPSRSPTGRTEQGRSTSKSLPEPQKRSSRSPESQSRCHERGT